MPSLRWRVIQASSAVAAVVGLLAAGLALTLAHDATSRSADRRLLDAAQLIAAELAEPDATLEAQVVRESRELLAMGMHLAVFRDATFVGGDQGIPHVTECGPVGELRACVLRSNDFDIVVAASESVLSWWVLLGYALLGTTLAAVTGALASRASAAWALRSLAELNRRIEVAPNAPDLLELQSPATTYEVERLRATFADLVGRLRTAHERARVFASGAAHELRTPIAVLSAELELFIQSEPVKAREVAQRALRTVRRLNVLIETLLALAKGDDQGPRRDETLALQDIVGDSVGARNDRELERVDLAFDDEGMVRGSEVLLRAVVDNLLDNALKHSNGRVLIRVERRDERVFLSLKDEGPGIDPKRLPELVRPFVRGTGGAEGHGLGLSIAAHAAALHAGSLSVDAQGAVVVTLPGWAA